MTAVQLQLHTEEAEYPFQTRKKKKTHHSWISIFKEEADESWSKLHPSLAKRGWGVGVGGLDG